MVHPSQDREDRGGRPIETALIVPPQAHPSYDHPLWFATLKLVRELDPGKVVLPFAVKNPNLSNEKDAWERGANETLGSLRWDGYKGKIIVQVDPTESEINGTEFTTVGHLAELIGANKYRATVASVEHTVIPGWVSSTAKRYHLGSGPPGSITLEEAVRRGVSIVRSRTEGSGMMTRTESDGSSYSGMDLGHRGTPGGRRGGCFGWLTNDGERSSGALLPIVGSKIHYSRKGVTRI